jgi:hypothetical protein
VLFPFGRSVSLMCKVGQNHIYIPCIYGNFGRKITKYTFIYGVYIRFWHLCTASCRSVSLMQIIFLNADQCPQSAVSFLQIIASASEKSHDSVLCHKKPVSL